MINPVYHNDNNLGQEYLFAPRNMINTFDNKCKWVESILWEESQYILHYSKNSLEYLIGFVYFAQQLIAMSIW